MNKKIIIFIVITLLVFVTRYFYIPTKSKYEQNMTEITGIITKVKKTNNTYSFTLKGKELVQAVYFTKEDIKLKIGNKVILRGTLEEIKEQTIPDIYSYKKYYRSLGCFYQIKVEELEIIGNKKDISYFARRIIERSPKSERYLKSLLLKDNSLISKEIMDSYEMNNLLHLLSLSGMHLNFLAIVLKKYRIIYFLLLVLIFLLLGNNVSFLRIIITQVIILILPKNISKTKIWCLSTGILLWINPYFIDQIGFWYTIVISGILMINSKKLNKEKNKLKALIMVSIISFIGSLPITLFFSYEVNLLSIISNCLLVPFFTYVILPLLILTLFIPMFDIVANLSIKIFEFCSISISNIDIFLITKGRPSTVEMIILIIILVFLLYVLINRKKIGIVIVSSLLMLYLVTPYKRYDNIVFLDVLQGDSSYFYSEHQSMLIDTGEKRKDEIIKFLKSQGVTKLKYLILTHGDQDHVKNTIDILKEVDVEVLIYNNGQLNNLEKEILSFSASRNIKVEQCTEGKTYQLGNFKLLALTQESEQENNNSCIFYINNQNKTFLLTGDMTKLEEEKIMKNYLLPEIDYLKVAHHGSKTSSTDSWIKYLRPKNAIISVSSDNRYNHPSKVVIESLKRNTINMMATNKDGSIKITLTTKVVISTFPPYNTLGR